MFAHRLCFVYYRLTFSFSDVEKLKCFHTSDLKQEDGASSLSQSSPMAPVSLPLELTKDVQRQRHTSNKSSTIHFYLTDFNPQIFVLRFNCLKNNCYNPRIYYRKVKTFTRFSTWRTVKSVIILMTINVLLRVWCLLNQCWTLTWIACVVLLRVILGSIYPTCYYYYCYYCLHFNLGVTTQTTCLLKVISFWSMALELVVLTELGGLSTGSEANETRSFRGSWARWGG